MAKKRPAKRPAKPAVSRETPRPKPAKKSARPKSAPTSPKPAKTPPKSPPAKRSPASPAIIGPEDKHAKRKAAHERHKKQAREWQRAAATAAREIGKVPAPVDPDRRAEAKTSFRRYCEIYQANAFSLNWSPDHLRAISKLEQATMHGGLFAFAMPRGSGKTTLSTAAAEWSILYGYRRWTCVIGATEPAARALLTSIKLDILYNELLQEDFPESVGLLAALDNEPRNVKGQRVLGKPTACHWSKDKIIFPTIGADQWEAGIASPASGATITVAGLLGKIRGQFERVPDGSIIRPDLAICDDPQTRRSAHSRLQTQARWATLNGDVLGLAGPGTKISGICPCTVIQPGDMADQLLDHEVSPEWRGERSKLMNRMPDSPLWDEYARILREELEAGGDGSLATAFYAANQVEMDRGGEPGWPERFNPDEISAIQNAMNLKLRDPDVFAAEYQNEPNPPDVDGENDQLQDDEVLAKVGGYSRGTIPTEFDQLTAFLDVQRHALYWMVCAWKTNFTGLIVDYGIYPDQKTQWVTYRKILHRLEDLRKGQPYEAQLLGGLSDLVTSLDRDWEREDGVTMRLARLIVDAGDGAFEEQIYSFCRQSPTRPIPWKGVGIGPDQMPMHEYKRRPGEKMGPGYMYGPSKYKVRRLLADVNQWKTFALNRIRTPRFAPGSLEIFNGRHKLLAAQLTSEYSIKTSGRGRVVWTWKHRPERFDNHWWDCLVGNCVAASMGGAKIDTAGLPGTATSTTKSSAASTRPQTTQRPRVQPLKF